ncbi:MAG TPA: acyl-CoA reductase [Chitinophagaceae bacterium]|jgi:hypothetical protein|nr:acyl-CoA reductase [Chitinophagaceae bacterium]
MKIEERKELMVRLGAYLQEQDEAWERAKERAFAGNNWFIPEFIEKAVQNIAHNYLQRVQLDTLHRRYALPEEQAHPLRVGIVMAGNIPLVGFHDLLCVFLSGHIAVVKPSSKDEALIKQLVAVLTSWDDRVAGAILLQPLLKGCDAYIATGSNNTGRYFEQYFSKYPHIIRKNRTSVAVLTGSEGPEELEALADDIHLYFGMGCRNVTKLLVPRGYDFLPLLQAGGKWSWVINHHKYKNNYDYNLAIHILNNRYYMTNGAVLLVEDPSPFAPISQVHYEFYDGPAPAAGQAGPPEAVQCIVGRAHLPFGEAQKPCVEDFADGIDTLQFLTGLTEKS